MEVLPHHIKPEVCHTRPKYRQGKIPKAVKVYTCAQESKYLLVINIPSIGVHNELTKLFSVYGSIDKHKILDEYPCDKFCETILIKFNKIEHARTAKIKLDNYNFYGGSLHVCYAPEYESIEDTREKLNERKYIVSIKCKKYDSIKYGTPEFDSKKLKKVKKKLKKTENLTNTSENIIGPQLPSNWVKPTITGSVSYDQTVKEIRKKMEKTQSRDHYVSIYPKKRKKILQL
ncbi:unnamed protein product [Brachionus calyciflorus]|uniref:RNA-binding protein 48 n=1 Tax=Brachionus calyciflorus TaxID=104777 RepID=A0A813R1W4_9BILA|nr:unnamed protein product [Brachionus calyciflorus]